MCILWVYYYYMSSKDFVALSLNSFPKKLKDDLKKLAEDEHRSLEKQIIFILSNFIKKNK